MQTHATYSIQVTWKHTEAMKLFSLQKLINVNFFHSSFSMWCFSLHLTQNALKWKQQFIYNKINGRQIVSTAPVWAFLFRIACTQTIALLFSLASANCLEVIDNNRTKKKECWKKLKFTGTNQFLYFWWQACCRWKATWMVCAHVSVCVCGLIRNEI